MGKKRRRTLSLVTDDKDGFSSGLTGIDGKWGWFVVFNSFVCNLIVDGAQYTFANFLMPIAHTFNTSITEVALIGALLPGFYNFSGPLAGALGNKFGFRMVAITGSIVSALGLIASYFAPNIEYLYFFYGIIGGLGFGMVYMASVITTSVYFEKYRALAASLSVCGTGVGTFVFSPMGTWLVTNYGWRIALVAEGGICLVCLLCGLSFKPLEIITVIPITNEPSVTSFSFGSVMSMGKTGSVFYPAEMRRHAPNTAFPTFREALQLQEALGEGTGTSFDSPTTYSGEEGTTSPQGQPQLYSIMGRYIRSNSAIPENAGKQQKLKRWCRVCCFSFWHCRRKNKNLTLGDRPLYRDDIFYGGSLASLPAYAPSEGFKYHLSVTRVPAVRELEEHVTQKCCVCHQAVIRTIATMTGINLLRSAVFTFLCASSFFYTMSLYIPFVFIRKVADEVGIDEDQSMWLVSAIGIANTAGRLASGLLKSFLPVNTSLFVLITLLLSGLVGFMFFLFLDLTALITYSCLFGLLTAPFVSLRPVMLVDFLGLEKLTNAFGLVLLSQGVASIAGPPLAGYVGEFMGKNIYVLHLAGSLMLASTLTLLLAMVLQKRKSKK